MAGLWDSKPPAHAKETPKENAERQMKEQKNGARPTTTPRERRKPTRPDPSRWFPF